MGWCYRKLIVSTQWLSPFSQLLTATMSEAEILLVKKSWKKLQGIDPALMGDLFYTKLFASQPVLRKMFPTDMEMQHQKLMDMLNVIVTRLDLLHEISPDISAMGDRHTGYGVEPSHYDCVGIALLWTLEKGIGKEWNAPLAAAWDKCYNTIALQMSITP